MEREETGFSFISLKSLADFLNFSFVLMDSTTLDALRYQYGQWPVSLAASLWTWDPDDAVSENDACNLQQELQRDLTPIIPPAKVDNPTEAYKRIDKLFKKINDVGLHTGWSIDPVEHTWAPVRHSSEFGAFELIKKAPVKKRETSETLSSPQRVIDVLGYKWFLGRVPEGFSTTLSRDKLYLVILDALERGEFSRLKRCQSDKCQKFFIADPPGKSFCNPEHTLEADENEATRHVREQRIEEEEEKQRKAWPSSERKAFVLFLKLLKQARTRKYGKESPGNTEPTTHALDQWEKGSSLNEIWLGFDAEVKNTFQATTRNRAKRKGKPPEAKTRKRRP
jgi:hypothetical protein